MAEKKPEAIELLTDLDTPLEDAVRAFEKRTRRWKPVNRNFTMYFGLNLRAHALRKRRLGEAQP
jgi:hypothetical protein